MSDPSKPKRHGCFFYGCLITVIVVIVGVVGTILGVRSFINKTIATYTDAAPTPLPAVQLSSAQIESARKRWDDFMAKVKAGQPASALVLSANDLNALIAATGTNGLKDKLVATIEGGQLTARASLPLDRLNWRLLRGRYLNGSIVFKVGLTNGALLVQTEAIRVKDRPLPAWLMTQLRAENWAPAFMNAPDAAAVEQRLAGIAVTNGALVVTPRQP